MAKEAKSRKKIYSTTWAVVAFIVIVIAFGFFVFNGSEKGQGKNPLENKKIIDMNVTCTNINDGAKVLSELYDIPAGPIILSQCRSACTDAGNLALYDYKCPSDDRFLCYCNLPD